VRNIYAPVTFFYFCHIYNKQIDMISIYYLHRGDNTPIYVGQTGNPKLRTYNHKQALGKDIVMEIIDSVKQDEILFWERHYMSLFKSWGFKLLNKNKGGGGCPKGVKKPYISECHKGRISPNLKKGKKILQYSLDGEFISEWNNINHALDKLNLGIVNESIRQVLVGKSYKSGGFIWKYYTEDYPLNLSKDEVYFRNNPTYGPLGQKLSKERGAKISKALKGIKREDKYRAVNQYDKEGNLLNTFPSITEASNVTGAWISCITTCCRGNQKTANGYIWKYVS
jgi:hypothetical protein